MRYNDTELTHFGVLGMKWGVRKDDRSGRGRSGSKSRVDNRSDDVKSLPRNFKPGQPTDSLSDEDLRKILNRLRMDREFKDLTKAEVKQGSEVVKTVKKAALAAVGTAVTAGLIAYMKKRAKGTQFEW